MRHLCAVFFFFYKMFLLKAQIHIIFQVIVTVAIKHVTRTCRKFN
jgi:hypothetical protein